MPVDTSGIRSLARDLGRLADGAQDRVTATVTRAALNIKTDMQTEAREAGSTYFARVWPSISYDVVLGPAGVEAEIGPEIGRAQGSLAWIAYEGSATSGPRLPDPSGALEREADALDRYLAEAVTEGFR